MQKKIACVNDISGIGKCSLTVALPLISALRCQCCPLPTSVLSSQTGYPVYSFVDLTDSMKEYIDAWHKLNQKFDTIYSGFLGSKNQIKLVEHLINLNHGSYVVVDPILGDLGKIFPFFSEEDVFEMKKLVSMANLITPNITEANLILGRKTDFLDYTDDELLSICRELSDIGPESVVITGFIKNDEIINICYERKNDQIIKIGKHYNKISFSGTGDIFTSTITALITRGYGLSESVEIATDFIYESVGFTAKQKKFDRNDGIMFEEFLNLLFKY